MAKISANYEVVFVLDPAQGEEAIAAQVANFKTLAEHNGSYVVVEEWGSRKLAYPINYKTEGWHVLVTLKAPSALPREIGRNLGNMEAILRYLFVKLEEKRSNVKPRPVRVAPAVETAAEAAPAAETAETAPAQAE